MITLVRILLDHDDASVLRLLHKVKQVLQPGGVLLIVEPFSGVRGAETVGDVYFGLYLRAMGRGAHGAPTSSRPSSGKRGSAGARSIRPGIRSTRA